MGGGGKQYHVSLEVNRKVLVSYIPLSELENIPIIIFSKYSISLVINKNNPEIINTNVRIQEHFVKYILRVMHCVLHLSANPLT